MPLNEPKKFKGRKHPAQRRSSVQEHNLAKKVGGSTTLGSGSKAQKGDVRVPKITRLEAKCTSKRSFRVDLETIRKIEDAGLPNDEIPAIVVEFIDQHQNVIGEVAVIPTYALYDLIERTK